MVVATEKKEAKGRFGLSLIVRTPARVFRESQKVVSSLPFVGRRQQQQQQQRRNNDNHDIANELENIKKETSSAPTARLPRMLGRIREEAPLMPTPQRVRKPPRRNWFLRNRNAPNYESQFLHMFSSSSDGRPKLQRSTSSFAIIATATVAESHPAEQDFRTSFYRNVQLDLMFLGIGLAKNWLEKLFILVWMILPPSIVFPVYRSVLTYLASVYDACCVFFEVPARFRYPLADFRRWIRAEEQLVIAVKMRLSQKRGKERNSRRPKRFRLPSKNKNE